jgi:hypothetical protein
VNNFGFVFGSVYKVPSKSFDFDKWSKLSYAARLPNQISIRDGLARLPSKKSNELIAGKDLNRLKEESTKKEIVQVEAELEKGPLTKTAFTTLTEDFGTQTEEEGNPSEPPRTPTKNSQMHQEDSLLTPEATPEPANLSILTKEDLARSELIDTPVDKQDNKVTTPINEGIYITSERTEDAVPPSVVTPEEVFGHVTITTPARNYKMYLSSQEADTLLTPPASPELSQGLASSEISSPDEPQCRSSAVIRRKALPSPQQIQSDGPETGACEACGQITELGVERCRCEHKEQIEWEIEANNRSSFRARGLRKLKKRAAKTLIGVKTGVTKVADSIGEMAHALETDGVDQSSV